MMCHCKGVPFDQAPAGGLPLASGRPVGWADESDDTRSGRDPEVSGLQTPINPGALPTGRFNVSMNCSINASDHGQPRVREREPVWYPSSSSHGGIPWATKVGRLSRQRCGASRRSQTANAVVQSPALRCCVGSHRPAIPLGWWPLARPIVAPADFGWCDMQGHRSSRCGSDRGLGRGAHPRHHRAAYSRAGAGTARWPMRATRWCVTSGRPAVSTSMSRTGWATRR